MIEISATVEYYVLDILGNSALADELTNSLSCLYVAAYGYGTLNLLVECRSTYKSCSVCIIDDLSVNVAVASIYAKTRALCRSGNLLSYTNMLSLTNFIFINSTNPVE